MLNFPIYLGVFPEFPFFILLFNYFINITLEVLMIMISFFQGFLGYGYSLFFHITLESDCLLKNPWGLCHWVKKACEALSIFFLCCDWSQEDGGCRRSRVYFALSDLQSPTSGRGQEWDEFWKCRQGWLSPPAGKQCPRPVLILALFPPGLLCEENIDDCARGPHCLNGGQCVDKIGGYSCRCLPGFAGERCEGDINECLSSPCSPEGSLDCIQLTNDYQCVCRSAFTGERSRLPGGGWARVSPPGPKEASHTGKLVLLHSGPSFSLGLCPVDVIINHYLLFFPRHIFSLAIRWFYIYVCMYMYTYAIYTYTHTVYVQLCSRNIK